MESFVYNLALQIGNAVLGLVLLVAILWVGTKIASTYDRIFHPVRWRNLQEIESRRERQPPPAWVSLLVARIFG